MWISRKKWEAMEKRMTDIEKQIQRQPLETISILCGYWHKEMTKTGNSKDTSHLNFQNYENQCDE